MEWTRDKTLALINEYRKRRGLWDMTHDDYRKKEMKQKLLLEVSTTLGGGIAIVEIEKKFHTLRTQYHREISRMKRREPYNSKWFGFKNLQFLSSPKACRSNKGRIKSEITEDGTVTTKYILRETPVSQHDTSGGGGGSGSANSSTEEFLTIHRKPTITYEVSSAGGGSAAGSGANNSRANSRTHELEKLIEETTKDVDDIDDAKPKILIKEITVPLDHHNYTTEVHTAGSSSEFSAGEQDPLQQHEDPHGHTTEDQMVEVEEPMETIDIQPEAEEDESIYQTNAQAGNITQHHHGIPTRIIKIPRRDTCPEEESYYEETHHHQTTMPAHHGGGSTTKRIYYDANGHQQHATATILSNTSTPTLQHNSNSSLLSTTSSKFKQKHQTRIAQLSNTTTSSLSSSTPTRDEFATYGEYVANEMRGIMNREVLIALKHKINTALFEASMAELQK